MFFSNKILGLGGSFPGKRGLSLPVLFLRPVWFVLSPAYSGYGYIRDLDVKSVMFYIFDICAKALAQL